MGLGLPTCSRLFNSHTSNANTNYTSTLFFSHCVWFFVYFLVPVFFLVSRPLRSFAFFSYQSSRSQAYHCLAAHYKAARTCGCGNRPIQGVTLHLQSVRSLLLLHPFSSMWVWKVKRQRDDVHAHSPPRLDGVSNYLAASSACVVSVCVCNPICSTVQHPSALGLTWGNEVEVPTASVAAQHVCCCSCNAQQLHRPFTTKHKKQAEDNRVRNVISTVVSYIYQGLTFGEILHVLSHA